MTDGSREGVVLCGGYSTRFGDGDKALADLAGTPLVRRVADRLATVCDRLVLNCRDEQAEALRAAVDGCGVPVSVATDPVPDRGPAAGIAAGLAAVDATHAAVVACDMPFVDPAFVAYLFSRADGRDAAVPRPDEWYQTTQAVYRADAMVSACERTLNQGESRVVDALDQLDDWVTVTEEEVRAHATPETFENLNTRAELRAAARRFESS
ncbi:molybdopterin-guanine dinucleotide biosynthesis protein A [Halogeometricum pallidum JCM 14848]|uniref:Probable molybdenum cofactor guanylyltransferase n=1 Tax=Halogeometricum pallidum JCM 14848 TaxID=1227487 RepID=M0CXQ7_HALPD|nr:molybdenum cofactor guanylyltransferase [Halogeometricum pallidum]ELZ26679.1 molybdopterin-guanine dinucleotide biosynthesis protein A [Halogeometricum pallidum JCM 14848]